MTRVLNSTIRFTKTYGVLLQEILKIVCPSGATIFLQIFRWSHLFTVRHNPGKGSSAYFYSRAFQYRHGYALQHVSH